MEIHFLVLHLLIGLSSQQGDLSDLDSTDEALAPIDDSLDLAYESSDVAASICGRTNQGSRIIGGGDTVPNQYPWQVGLAYSHSSKSPACGGSIINVCWVLTAAHCFARKSRRIELVVVGEHTWSSDSETDATRIHHIDRIVIHPGYDHVTKDNDVALIRVDEMFVFDPDNKVAPVCPPIPNKSYANVKAIVTGWGALKEGGNIADTLQEVHVPTLSNSACEDEGQLISPNMICAGIHEGGKDSCQGDSGGPMITADGLVFRLIGVVSHGHGCGRPGNPGVYSRVTSYLEWISRNMEGKVWE